MRRVIQILLLILFLYLLAVTRWPPSETVMVDTFLTLDPLLSFQAILASRTWVPAAFYGIILLVLSLILGRFFCGWVCPFGTCLELGDDLVYSKKKRKWKNHERRYRELKYLFLIVILISAALGQGLAYLFDPICWITRIFTFGFWPVLVAVGNVGVNLGRPLFEAAGWMNLARMDIPQPVFHGFGFISIALFVLLVWLGRYQRRFWCRNLCPLGALLAIPARFSLFHRQVGDSCDDDGRCAKTCETGAISTQYRKYDPGECIQCGRCVKNCHLDITSFVPKFINAQKEPAFDLTRRKVVAALGIGVVGSAWLAFNPQRFVQGEDALRPPGALPEKEFLAKCVRCGQCSKVCPTNCLQPSIFQAGAAGFMAPMALMRLGSCDQNCNACGSVCPTDAIRSLDFEEKQFAKIGNAVIEPGRCVVWEQGRDCLVCDENCPYGAIYWEEIKNGERRPFVDENRCNGCGQCEMACPVEGVAAIRVYPAGQIRLATGSYLDKAKEHGLILKKSEYGEG